MEESSVDPTVASQESKVERPVGRKRENDQRKCKREEEESVVKIAFESHAVVAAMQKKNVTTEQMADDEVTLVELRASRGHELRFFTGDDKTEKTMELERFGERMFENIVMFTPGKALGSLRKSDLLNFVESGGNMLLSARKRITKVQRDFALGCGVEFDKKKLPITLYPDAEVARDSLVYRVKDNLTYSLDLHELKDASFVASI
ncbi:hypothetical protein PsorP6_016721 [Peronosclerospora sorghi]|uniref:Uncharacterized protein n=1 Tax=Peronosclerospora sorghi TaxID=230839 RepID=A0ACC0WBP6_9STRA|nr:hypothetical protein PsorP6_016721 [Peronosclerospora sorghi]